MAQQPPQPSWSHPLPLGLCSERDFHGKKAFPEAPSRIPTSYRPKLSNTPTSRPAPDRTERTQARSSRFGKRMNKFLADNIKERENSLGPVNAPASLSS